MSKSIIDNISTLENLHWAWQKLKSAYANATDIWLNNIEIESFEGELEENLLIIQAEIRQGTYKLNPIYPVAYPKRKDKEQGHITRPAFYINVRDQLAWIAVLNVIGSNFDYQMPFWSFGHRMYITTWIEDNDSDSNLGKLKYGWYRNTTKSFYRNWKQSWPRFRRHIFLTIRAMSGKLYEDKENNTLSEQDLRELESNLEAKQFLKNEYLEKDYWPNTDDELYWCSIDLKKFYPSIDREVVLKNVTKYHDTINDGDETFNLVSKLLDFKIAEDSGWKPEEIRKVFEDEKEPQIGLPTGLIVSGFLSNIAMLEVDMEIQRKLPQKEFACFRFVDDYVILAKDIDNLKKWYEEYEALLMAKLPSVKIGQQKIEPEEFRDWISNEGKIKKEDVILKCKIDPDNPSPLVTQTLLKLSLIAGQDINFLTDDESQKMINDLKHFLLTDFADHEIKKETQVSFALTLLSKLLPELKKDYSQVHKIRREKLLIEKQKNIEDKEEVLKKYDDDIRIEVKKADKKYNLQVQKFFLFFINTVLDNYAKPKLWLRLIEYCSRVGYPNVKEVFYGIDSLKAKDELDELNYDAINILCVAIISEVSLKIFKEFFIQNKFVDERKKMFLKSFYTEENIEFILSRLNGEKYNSKITRVEFLLVCRIANDIINPEFNNSKLKKTDIDIYSLSTSNKNELLFWIYRNICSSVKPNNYWIKLSKNIDFTKPLAKTIGLLSDNIETMSAKDIDFRIINRKWEILNLRNSNEKTLLHYLNDCQKSSYENLFFSEYAALLLTNEIINIFENEFHSLEKHIDLNKIVLHPGCLKFREYPKQQINSWSVLTNYFNRNSGKLFHYNSSELLPDKRYLPNKILEYKNKEIAEVYSIGVFLWQMCNKQSVLPNELFIDNGRFFINLTNHENIKYFPSSYSDFIIRSCLSPITRETTWWINKRIILKDFEHALQRENEKKGYPPAVLDLIELRRRVNLAKKLLKKDQLNISDNMGRQLVYLSFISPTALNDILKDESK